MNINVLILSVGRRVELLKCFRDASKLANVDSKIITADISETAPATFFSDKNYRIPRVGEEGYLESIIDICNINDIKLIIPTIDTELYELAKNKFLIEKSCGAKVLVSDKSVIEICRDKRKTSEFFENYGFKGPKEISLQEVKNKKQKFPLFIKPVDGSSSINAFKVNNELELEFFIKYIDNAIIQEFVEGIEYTVDVFIDFEGKIVSIVPRERLATRSGEVSKGKIVKDLEIINKVKELVSRLEPIGHITIQCIKNGSEINFIEINPRFGGGAPISIKAGANSPLNLYKLLKGETLKYNEDYEDELICLRFDQSIFIDKYNNILD